MAESVTINLNSYLNVPADTSSVSKSYMDNSSNFANIFQDINESYANKEDSIDNTLSQSPSDQVHKSNTQENPHTISSNNTEKSITEKTENTENTDVVNTEAENIYSQAETTKPDESECKTKVADEKKSNSEKTVNSSESDQPNITEANASIPVGNTLEALNIVGIASGEVQIVQEISNVNTGSKTNNAEVKNKEVLSDLKINVQDASSKSAPIATDVINETSKQATMIEAAPQVVLANNAVNVDENTSTKQNTKEVLDKTPITQDILNQTNAKVVSVETSNSNSNDLLNKQNPEEHLMKMSLRVNDINSSVNVKPEEKAIGISPKAGSTGDNSINLETQSMKMSPEVNNSIDNLNINPNVSNIADTPVQANFVKTLENVQSSKELSHSDLLSQINSKLDNLQTEAQTKVNIILKPENLGKINLELINSKDGLIAKMTTDNQQVKEILDKNLEGLKNTLSNQGVNVNNVTVKVDETQKQSNDMFSFAGKDSNQGNQEFSGNSDKSNKSETSFEGKSDSLSRADVGETKTTEGSEDLISISSHTGQVDYKI